MINPGVKRERRRAEVEEHVHFAIDAFSLLTAEEKNNSVSATVVVEGSEELGAEIRPDRSDTLEPPDIYEWYERMWD